MRAASRTPCESIQPAGTWWGEPAGEEVVGRHNEGFLFLAKEPSGRRRTWGEGWGLGRETPGSETRDLPAIVTHYNLYSAEAAMFLGKVTVRPLAIANHLLGNYYAWVEGAKYS